MTQIPVNTRGEVPDRTALYHRLAEEARERFEGLSEEDQILYRLAQKLGPIREVVTDMDSRLNLARQLITAEYGPKFAERIFSTPELLAKLRLEPTEQELDQGSIARTVVVEDEVVTVPED